MNDGIKINLNFQTFGPQSITFNAILFTPMTEEFDLFWKMWFKCASEILISIIQLYKKGNWMWNVWKTSHVLPVDGDLALVVCFAARAMILFRWNISLWIFYQNVTFEHAIKCVVCSVLMCKLCLLSIICIYVPNECSVWCFCRATVCFNETAKHYSHCTRCVLVYQSFCMQKEF